MAAIVVFRGVIAEVFLSRMPSDSELFILHLVADIEISHFHGSGALFFDGTIGDAGGGSIITVDGGWRLWVAKFL
jgi:hypothetical protein